MTNKSRFIILLSLIFIFFAYTKLYSPSKDKQDIKNELEEIWDIDIAINSKDGLLIYEENKRGWYGEQQKFILFEVDNIDNFMDTSIFYKKELPFDLIGEVIDIEKILDIPEKDRVIFEDIHFYQKRINYQVVLSSEAYNDILYVFLIKENGIWKVFFIEDLNVLDMDRSM